MVHCKYIDIHKGYGKKWLSRTLVINHAVMQQDQKLVSTASIDKIHVLAAVAGPLLHMSVLQHL